MFLRPPSWADDSLRSSSGTSAAASPGAAQAPIVDLVLSLTNQRLYREVSLSLRIGLRDVKAEFSFMRIRGLKSLTRFLTSAVKSEKIVELFLDTQKYRELQVVPVLFEHALAPLKSEVVNNIVVGSPSKGEIGLALRILEGCCLLDTGSRKLASRYAAAKVLMALLLSGEPPEQIACLDALLAVLLDSTSNQKDFERMHGVRKIAELVKNTSVDDGVRLKCAEFLLLLIGYVLPANTRPANGFQHAEGRKGVVTIEGARQEVADILGRRCSEVLIALTSSELANVDFDTEQTSLGSLSRTLVELS
ncbi:unnamed protein product [Calypogeia fissa]